MSEPADPAEILRLLKRLSLEDRQLIATELLAGIHNEGGQVDGDPESDPEFLMELERRVDEAIDHPERSIPAANSIARARAAVAAFRSERKS